MYYIKSTSSKEYVLNGKRVPKVDSNKYLELNTAEYNSIMQNRVVASLKTHGDILVLDTMPESMKNDPSKIKQNLAELTSQNTALQAELATLRNNSSKELEALRKEALEELDKKDKEIARLNKELEVTQKKLTKAEVKKSEE